MLMIKLPAGYPSELFGATSEFGENRTLSQRRGLVSRKRSFLRGARERNGRVSTGLAWIILENHSRLKRPRLPSFENG